MCLHPCLQGQDLLERSSELIHSGELTSVTRQGKSQQRTFFLFDHQLVFCKKDLLRRDVLYYRGRADTDAMELVDLEDGRDGARGPGLRNAFRLASRTGDEVHLFCARKPEDKARWLQAFRDERRRVQEDRALGEPGALLTPTGRRPGSHPQVLMFPNLLTGPTRQGAVGPVVVSQMSKLRPRAPPTLGLEHGWWSF